MLEFRLLGPLEVRDGERLIELPGHKQRALLVALLLGAGRVVSKDELLEALWGASPPPRAESSLQNHLSQLRKALGADAIVTRPPGYVLPVEPGQVDVARFERLVAHARGAEPRERAATLREALSLVRGQHLADLRFEAFAQGEIRRLEELELAAREDLLRAELELGHDADAVPELEALVAAHPFREGLWYLLMLALYRSGRQADALAAYRGARDALVDELGIEPGPELQELERAILRQEPSLSSPSTERREETHTVPAPPVPRRARRKTVTVLAVAAERSSGGERDPESLHDASERLAAAASAAVAGYGGSAERVADGVTGLFGIPAVHDDDPLRAVRAAAELRDDLTAQGVAPGFGVATGEVLAEDGARGSAATGDVVVRAAELARDAEPGEIVLARECAEVLRGAVVVAERGSAASLRLVEVLPAAGPRSLRLDARLVGRTGELAALDGALANACDQRTCHLFTLLGEAGVGKSRVVTEFLSSLGGRAAVAAVRCLPYGGAGGLASLRDAIRIAGADTDALSADAASEEVLAGLRRTLEALARERPLVLVIDDAHWAEPRLLDAVEHVVDRSRGAAILAICVARPELYDERPAWGGGKPNAHALFLQPLAADESERLLDDLLGASDLPEPVRAHIVGAAGGNPLFLEELLATLVDRAVLRREAGRWTTGELPVLRTPATIQALIASRIDRLPDDERLVLELAAVEGTVFAAETVAVLAPADAAPRTAELLERLTSRELVRPVVGEDDVFVFRHQLVRDGAYQSMPKRARAELHERLAAMAGRPAEQRDYHRGQAQEYRRELGELETHPAPR